MDAVTKRRKRNRPLARKLRLLRIIHAREQRGLEAPAWHWFNADARRVLRSLIKNGFVTYKNPGARLTNKGRALIGAEIK